MGSARRAAIVANSFGVDAPGFSHGEDVHKREPRRDGHHHISFAKKTRRLNENNRLKRSNLLGRA